MHFSGPIVRPQTDADSLFIEVTIGCTHNSCRFCNFYEGGVFRNELYPANRLSAGIIPLCGPRNP